jgi:hypothetical protein
MSWYRTEAEVELLTFWRRMLRSQQACVVLAVELGALQLIQENPRSHRVQKRLLEDLATRQRGQTFSLPDGGVVLAVPGADIGTCEAMVGEIVGWILRDPSLSEEGSGAGSVRSFCRATTGRSGNGSLPICPVAKPLPSSRTARPTLRARRWADL